LRLGWYGGLRARQISYARGYPPDYQSYPVAESTYGLTEAHWHDSAAPPAARWAPRFFVARGGSPHGDVAETPLVLRGDAGPRMPILVVLSTTTRQAYNAWPGPNRGGKSLYAFNSSSTVPTQSNSIQAVKVSFDRPYFVGGGSADFGTWEYPMAAFLEENG